MKSIRYTFLSGLLLFLLFLSSGDLNAQTNCREDCEELVLKNSDPNCPCEMDIHEAAVQLVGTIDPCHCHIFRTIHGIYVKEVQQRNGDTIIQMSRNLGPGAQPRLFNIQSTDVNQYIEDIFQEIELNR